MRALLVCAAPVPGSAALVADLSRDHDVIIGVDGGAALCSEAGILPDLVVGDLDSLVPRHLDLLVGRGAQIERFSPDKSSTDLDLALDAARTHGADSVTVTAASSGRLDHTLAVAGSLARAADLNPCITEPGLNGWLLSASATRSVTLRGAHSVVSLLALTGPATVSCTGFTWPLDFAQLEPLSTLGISNLLHNERGTVEVHEGILLVLSPQVGRTAPATKAL